MVILRPKIWHVCQRCGEFFYYNGKSPKKCPECKEGVLIKTCVECGKPSSECICVKEKSSVN